MGLVFPLTVFMGDTAANRILSIKRPSGDLLSFTNCGNLFGHIAITIAFQLSVFKLVDQQKGYTPITQSEEFGPISWYTTSLYYLCNFQYIIMAFLFSLGRPWKRWVWTNFKFVGWTAIAILLSTLLLFTRDPKATFFTSQEVMLPDSWRVTILFIMLVNVGASIIFEIIIFPALVKLIKSSKYSGVDSGMVFGLVCLFALHTILTTPRSAR